MNAIFQPYQIDFYKRFWKLIYDQGKAAGISPDLMISQMALESNWGRSDLAMIGKNYFGIKIHSWKGKTYGVYRAYNTATESISNYIYFLKTNSRYLKIFTTQDKTFETQAALIAAAGYATDPNYLSKLTAINKNLQLIGEIYRNEQNTTPPRGNGGGVIFAALLLLAFTRIKTKK